VRTTVPIPSPQNPWAGREKEIGRWKQWWEESCRNSARYTRDVPNGPDPKESVRAFSIAMDGFFKVAAGAGGILILWVGLQLFVRFRRPARFVYMDRAEPPFKSEPNGRI
jgi:hypothetical protein